jgi:hypothetical protein
MAADATGVGTRRPGSVVATFVVLHNDRAVHLVRLQTPGRSSRGSHFQWEMSFRLSARLLSYDVCKLIVK